MIRAKRWLAFFVAVILVLGIPCAAMADTKESLDEKIKSETEALNDAQDEKESMQSNLEAAQALKESLENTKDELSEYVVQLDSEMSEVSYKLMQVETLLKAKEKELDDTKKKLVEAKADIERQYANMKMRIKFMYEEGALSYLDILFSSSSFSDLLNKAEYIEQVSAYDREMLDFYEATKTEVEELEKELQSQQDILETVRKDVQSQQDEMQGLIDQKQSQIKAYQTDISNKEAAIKEYEEMIAAQDDIIRALEASVAAAKKKRQEMDVSGNSTEDSYSGGQFCWPAPSYTRISDDYGYRIHPTLGVQQFHNGVDMAAPSGSNILAAAGGTVIAATYNATMGNYIMIDHGGGLYTIYMHASALYVSSGATVSKGDLIAAVGSTGRSTGPHLHFGVRLNGNYVSPWNYL